MSPVISARAPWWRQYGPDLLLAGVLAVVAFLARRHGLPTDGLWLDDADPGAAVKASLSQLHLVGEDHPGFIVVLKGWSSVIGGSNSLAYPPFIAGTLGPPLLYLALRRFGYERSISFLLGAALAAAQTDIVNSGRVRTFTIDLLIVLGLAMILPHLTRTIWRWTTGAAWVAAAILVASISGFALAAIAVAGAIVVLHPASDLRVRAIAVGVQAAATLALLLVQAGTYNSATIEAQYRQSWDAFPDFHLNPLRFGGELLLHLRRLAEAFPGGPSWLAMLCGLAALAGLAAACFPGRQAIRARYLALLLAATVVGGLLGKVPFGPKESSPLDNGYRVSVWLIPVFAIGLAAVLQGLRGLLADRRALRFGFDTAAFVAAAAILLSAGPATRYPFPGAQPAAQFIESHLSRRDAVLIPFHAEWSFTAESSFAAKLQATPEQTESFDPLSWTDPRIHYVGLQVDAPHVVGAVKSAKRVFVYYPALLVGGLDPPESKTRTALASTLRSLGFERRRTVTYQDAKVDIFRRKEVTTAHTINLRLSDLPPGWVSTPPPASALTTGILACIHAPTVKTTQGVVTATDPKSQLNAVSEVTVWPSPTAAQSSYAALSGPDAAGCIKSTLGSALRSIGLRAAVTAKKVPPPPSGGDPAVAYTGTIRISNGTGQLAQGSIVFFTHKKAGVLIGGYSMQPFPANLLSSLVTTLADRVNAAAMGSR